MVDQRLREVTNITGCVVEFMLFKSPVLLGLALGDVVYEVVTDPSCGCFAYQLSAHPFGYPPSGPCPSCLPGVV